MEEKNKRYGVCGVYCGQCPNGNGRVKMMAGELKRLVDTARYDWMETAEKSFNAPCASMGVALLAKTGSAPLQRDWKVAFSATVI